MIEGSSAFKCTAVALMMLFSSPCAASWHGTVNEERVIARCIHRASGGKPWLEKTLWGLRDQEGGWIGAAVHNRDGSHDLGPFQINTWWVPAIAARLDSPRAMVTNWLRYDPCFNAEAARWIYMGILKSGARYWQAIGLYHSPVKWRRDRYVARVAYSLRRRYGVQVFSTGSADIAGQRIMRDPHHWSDP